MYSFAIELTGNLEKIEQKLIGALKDEGMDILAKTDIQATLNARSGVEKKPRKILAAFIPALTNRTINTKPDIGFIFPCNVAMHLEKDSVIRIAFMIPNVILNLAKRDDIFELSREVCARLLRVRQLMVGTINI